MKSFFALVLVLLNVLLMASPRAEAASAEVQITSLHNQRMWRWVAMCFLLRLLPFRSNLRANLLFMPTESWSAMGTRRPGIQLVLAVTPSPVP